MSVAAPFRRTIEDIAENAGDVIIIVIGIVILYALFSIGTKLWSGLQGLFAGLQNLGGLGGPGGNVPYTTAGGGTYTPSPTGGGTVTYEGQTYTVEPGGPRAQIGIHPSLTPTITYAAIPAISRAPGVVYTPSTYGQGYYALPSPSPAVTYGVPAGIISQPTKITIPGGAGGKI